MVSIREAAFCEISNLYDRFIIPYFHQDEIKPLSIIESMVNCGLYKVVVLCDNEIIVAAAFLVYSKNKTAILLDYFAVDKSCRSRGYGSAFLKLINDTYTLKIPLIIETESLIEDISSEDFTLRKRRNSFYERNGAIKTSETALIFGCLYDIWYICSEKKNDFAIVELYDEIYRLMLPSKMYKDNCFIPYK